MKRIIINIGIVIIGVGCVFVLFRYVYQPGRINQHLFKGLIYESEYQFDEAIKEYSKWR